MTYDFFDKGKFVVLLMDEMKIKTNKKNQKSLVCDKHNGELIGMLILVTLT